MYYRLVLCFLLVLPCANSYGYYLCSSENDNGTIHSVNIMPILKKHEVIVIVTSRKTSVDGKFCDENIGSERWKWSCLPNADMPRTMKWQYIKIDGVEYARYYEPELNQELDINNVKGLTFDRPARASEMFETEVFLNSHHQQHSFKIYCRHGDIG